jgi:hypothetical protein
MIGSPGLGLVAFVLWIVAVHQANFLSMGPLGLVSVLGWSYFVGLALVAAGMALELLHTPLRSNRLVFLIVLLVVFLFATASAVEPVAGTQSAFVIAGFVQHVYLHGQPLINYDARFSWPGSFSLGAVLVAFAGQTNAMDFLRWFPFIIELLYLPALLVIAKFSGVGRRAGFLGVMIFYSSNWIFQDYFSPQALNYLFFLVIVASVLFCWQPKMSHRIKRFRGGMLDRLSQSRDIFTPARLAGRDTVTAVSSPVVLGILVMLGLIFLASAMSHQLTPFAIMLALAACLLTRRMGRPELLIVASLFAVGWLSLGASNFWVGHLSDIFGSAGHVVSSYSSNVSSRVIGSSTHKTVVDIRILLTAGLYFLGGVGVLRRIPNSRTLEILVAAPFLLVVLQDYGGEGLLRVVLFGLPFVSLLAASAILPNRFGPIRPVVPKLKLGRYGRPMLCVATFVVVFGFALATTVVRGGNDAYEAFSKGELAAVNYAYDHSRPGETVGVVAPYLPFGQRDIESVQVFVASGGGTPPPGTEGMNLLLYRPAFIILSQSQEAWGEIVAGYPRGWEGSLEDSLVGKGYKIVAEWQTATVLESFRVSHVTDQ